MIGLRERIKVAVTDGYEGWPPGLEAITDTLESLVEEEREKARAEGYGQALSKPEIDVVRAQVLRDAAAAWERTWWDRRPRRFEDWLRARADKLTKQDPS